MSWLKEKLLGTREKFKGFFDTGKTVRKGQTRFHMGEHSWRARCKHYDQMCEEHGMAKQATVTIAGQLVAEGVFTESRYEEGPHAQRSLEAKELADELNERIGLDSLLYDTGIIMAKYGSCFWEKTLDPEFDVRIIPMQEAIEPAMVSEIGDVTQWRQNLWASQSSPMWGDDELIHFSWNVTSQSWPYGTSLLVGLETVLGTLQQLETNAKDYMEKQAWPYELWQIGDGNFMPDDDQINTIKNKWKNRAIGENMISTYPIDAKQGGTGGAPIRELSNLIEFLYNEAIDSTMIPPISRQYNATEASAKVMMPHAHATIVSPMQRILKRKIENELYKPFIELRGYSVTKTCPKLVFQPPDAHKEEDGEYYSKGVLAGIFPPKWAAKKLGVPEKEFDEWQKQEEEREKREFEQDRATFNAKNSAAKGEGSEKEKAASNA